MIQQEPTIFEPGEEFEIPVVGCSPDEVAAWAASAPLTEGILTPFGVLDPAVLSQDGRIDALIGLQRLKAWADAQEARILAAAAADPAPLVEEAKVPLPADPATAAVERARRRRGDRQFVREEIGCALHWSFGVTRERIHIARLLLSRLPDTLAVLEAGSISYLHARTLALAIGPLDDSTAGKVQARVLPCAPQRTPGEFRADVRRAVAALDPRSHETRQAEAAAGRYVSCQPDPDPMTGMAWLTACLPVADAETVMTALQALADKTTADDQRTSDQKLADALTCLAVAALTGGPGCGHGELPDLSSWQGRRPAVQVTVALSTLLGLDEQPGELDRHGPIPAQLARRIAADPSGTWRRLITDDAGRLLDYGRQRYRPPQDLRDYVIARDRTCTMPGCPRDARRNQIDHIQAWEDGGTTCPQNHHPPCCRHHACKHDAGWQVTRHDDGSTTWTSPLGRSYTKPPATYPIDTTLHPDHDDQPPPF